ncbi:hypothetical protein ACP70R_025766 [Stipagrostis hirtigluma subsp. patula]
MGRGGKKHKRGRRPPPPPPPRHPKKKVQTVVDLANSLGCNGMIMVLFETPSGFALFFYDGLKLLLPKAMEDVWSDFANEHLSKMLFGLNATKFLRTRPAPFSDGGVSAELAEMIKTVRLPGQTLAVGKKEYAEVIQNNLAIPCLFNDVVLEVMWGLKNLMEFYFPGENLKLTKEDTSQMSEGLKMILDRYGLDGIEVKPDMINKSIVQAAYNLYECDYCVNKNADSLRSASHFLWKIPRINHWDWDLLKLATALMIICYPEEAKIKDNASKCLSMTEIAVLVEHAPKYGDHILKGPCAAIYEEIVWAEGVKTRAKVLLHSLIRQAKLAYETEQAKLLEKPEVISWDVA